MSLLSRLFGKGGNEPAPTAGPETYEGFRIFPDPIKEAGGHRIAARIEMGDGDDAKVHNLVRADLCQTREEAVTMSLAKARQMIDEQGAGLFE